MTIEALVGTATVISSLAGRFVGYPAQIRLILKTRMVSNLSVTLHSIGFVSCLLWTWHGWLHGDWVILLTQGMAGIAATGSMLFLIWRYRPRRMAGEHLIGVLTGLARLAQPDGQVHASEQREIDLFLVKWQLTVDWAAITGSLDTREVHRKALEHLRQYLALHPPVAQMRELQDMVWVLAKADTVVTPGEFELASTIQQQLKNALSRFDQADSTPYRIVLMPRMQADDEGARTEHVGFSGGFVAGQAVMVSVASLTEPVARQYAAELRKQRVLALAVPDSDVAS
ncbi:SemiSWEET family transporter [Nevskia sp.]|uniref:SemiSWEET family sugar transporter n=1 Tax=Nevskia sp. TaxID=1929292 RepID=UPI0025D2E3AC|nr:SemiSWEET family transporter [Nevskia sp.]